MLTYKETILNSAEYLTSGRGLNYRQRLQLERAVFRLTSAHLKQAFAWHLRSMSSAAREEFADHCLASGVGSDDVRLLTVNLGFEVMRLIASIANADPYVLNENISRILHRYSSGIATLPTILREFSAATAP